jgi:hypothetical protein
VPNRIDLLTLLPVTEGERRARLNKETSGMAEKARRKSRQLGRKGYEINFINFMILN